jgi:hypothetical protein
MPWTDFHPRYYLSAEWKGYSQSVTRKKKDVIIATQLILTAKNALDVWLTFVVFVGKKLLNGLK